MNPPLHERLREPDQARSGAAASPGGPTPASAALVQRLREGRPLVTVELRPPRADLSPARSMDTWISMHHAIRRLVAQDTFVFLTDNAVGTNEEENLHHLQTNLEGVPPARLIPFLTCKHTLDYCLMYAGRAASAGYEALTVLGGDAQVGAPRCLTHAYELRRRIRQRAPGLALGGWANPHRDPIRQVDFLEEEGYTGDFFLTQVVSHHDLALVERFVAELDRRRITLPRLFGVFFYRSANAKTLKVLQRFLPVPAAELTREFEAGATAEELCAKTIRRLREVGVDQVYLSNLEFDRAARQLPRIRQMVEA